MRVRVLARVVDVAVSLTVCHFVRLRVISTAARRPSTHVGVGTMALQTDEIDARGMPEKADGVLTAARRAKRGSCASKRKSSKARRWNGLPC